MAKPLLDDELWEVIEPLLPPPKPRRFRFPGRNFLFLLTLVSVINQSQGDFFLVTGVICYMIGPMVYLVYARRLVRPHTAAVLQALRQHMTRGDA